MRGTLIIEFTFKGESVWHQTFEVVCDGPHCRIGSHVIREGESLTLTQPLDLTNDPEPNSGLASWVAPELRRQAVLDEVVKQLKRLCITATLEYPGIIMFGDWVFGTANDVWGGDFVQGDTVIDSVVTDVPSDCEDAERIAEAIAKAVTNFSFARR